VEFKDLALALGASVELATTVLVFTFLGYYLGRKLGDLAGVVGALVGIFVGLFLGVKGLVEKYKNV
jgi:putative Mn2+ efflux pump MntP